MAVVSFWLEPDVHGHKTLADLAKGAQTEVGGPTVVPHVTIRGSIEMPEADAIALLPSLAEGFEPITAKLSAVRLGTVWNKALYATAEGRGMSDVRERLCDKLSLATEAYDPHVSFAYGLSDIELRQGVGPVIARKLPGEVVFNKLSVWLTEAIDEDDVETWHRLAAVSL